MYNGAIEEVVEIIYKDKEGPNKEGALPEFVVVDFKHVYFEPWTK